MIDKIIIIVISWQTFESSHHLFSIVTVKSEGFNMVPHTVHLLLEWRSASLTDFSILIVYMTEPHLLQTTSVDEDINTHQYYLPK